MTIKAGKTEGGDALLYGTANNPQQGSRPIGWNLLEPENVPVLVELDTSGRPIRTVTPDGQVVGGGVSTNHQYATLAHVFGQAGGVAVLPKDFSPNPKAGVYGASMGGSNLPWANAGYLTTYAAGFSSFYQAPAKATQGVNVSTDSFAIFFTVRRASVAGSGADTLLGCSDGSSIPGFFVVMGQASNAAGPDRLGVRFFAGGTSQLGGTYATGTVANNTDQRVAITYDALTRVLSIYINGVLVYTSPALTVAPTDVWTGALRFGQGLSGSSTDCRFGDSFGLFVYRGRELPLNVASLVAFDNANRKTGIMGEPVFI